MDCSAAEYRALVHAQMMQHVERNEAVSLAVASADARRAEDLDRKDTYSMVCLNLLALAHACYDAGKRADGQAFPFLWSL